MEIQLGSARKKSKYVIPEQPSLAHSNPLEPPSTTRHIFPRKRNAPILHPIHPDAHPTFIGDHHNISL